MKRYVWIILALLVVSVAACQAENNTGKDSVSNQQTNVEDSGNTAGIGGSAKTDFLNTIKNKNKEYSVEYQMTVTGNGETQNIQMTQYFKGDNMRIDSEGTVQGEDVKSRVYIKDSITYMCMYQDGQYQCLTTGEADPSIKQQMEQTDIEANLPTGFNVVKKGSKTIAGHSTTCYALDLSSEGVSETVCLSKEGVPLYIEVTGNEGSSKMEALSYSTSVKDSDFDLPAEPQTFDPSNFNMPTN